MLRIARLKTLHMYDNNNHNDKDYLLHESIAKYMDGELAWVIERISDDGKIYFLCLKDGIKNKELYYMMEQDSMTGCFIDDREGFEKAWEDGEYERAEWLCLKPEHVIFEREG